MLKKNLPCAVESGTLGLPGPGEEVHLGEDRRLEEGTLHVAEGRRLLEALRKETTRAGDKVRTRVVGTARQRGGMEQLLGVHSGAVLADSPGSQQGAGVEAGMHQPGAVGRLAGLVVGRQQEERRKAADAGNVLGTWRVMILVGLGVDEQE